MTARSPSSGGPRIKPPPLQTTSLDRPQTANNPHLLNSQDSVNRTPPNQRDTTPPRTVKANVAHGEQRLVLTDPLAFRYLEDDPCTAVLERRAELSGYECYVIEQWTTSRTHPTFVINTYTGDPSHIVVVGVLGVPQDESTWSPRLRVYFKALNHYHASRRQTSLGILMVTNLSSFPSALTVIPVPDGDIRKHRLDFTVNENLKRLGCSGRIGLTLSAPSPATTAKFHQLYHTSDKNDVYQSVLELVKMCQSALTLFDKLAVDYADGLLCDMTERAINDWWAELGREQYNIDPHDGILGPTTVAGLLGLLMGARNRLHEANSPVAKDAFDVEAMKRGISHFQKQQRLTRTRRLDRRTLDRLHKVTQKAANSEGWNVPRAVKSTVAELSGKGGEMVMDVVGRHGRAGLADIETCDIDRFVHLVYGGIPKWLWFGQPLKKSKDQKDHSGVEKISRPNSGLMFEPDSRGGYAWTARKSVADGVPAEKHHEYKDLVSPIAETPEDSGEDDSRFKMVGKRASGFKQDAINGIGKIRDVVGRKGHHAQRSSLDGRPSSPGEEPPTVKPRRPFFHRSQSSPLSSPDRSPQLRASDRAIDAAVAEEGIRISTDPGQNKFPGYAIAYPEVPNENDSKDAIPPLSEVSEEKTQDSAHADPEANGDTHKPSTLEDAIVSGTDTANDTESLYNEITVARLDVEDADQQLLRRSLSLSHHITTTLQTHSPQRFPRHLSFSIAEDSILTWPSLLRPTSPDSKDPNLTKQLAEQTLAAAQAKTFRNQIESLRTSTSSWTETQLQALQSLLPQFDSDQQQLDSIYGPRLERFRDLQTVTEGTLREQGERFREGGTELETLAAKLDYEIAGLKSRVEDVEAGVSDFERDVRRVEERVRDLEAQGEVGRAWGNCVLQ